MSSETLRGIGKKSADGDAAGGGAGGVATGGATPSATPGPGGEKPATSLADKLGKIAERRDKHEEPTTPMATAESAPREAKPVEEKSPAMPLRSLDSTVPGTRSLDGSVPGAAPSLDARISRVTPPLSATLIGMPAPKFAALEAARKAAAATTPAPAPIEARGPLAAGAGRRDHGTAAGHDVHLPRELQRANGGQPASGSGPSDGTPRVILGAGLTEETANRAAYPTTTAAGAEAPRAGDELALGAHNPWYDQLPSAEEVYEDAKPNLVARIAVGAAAAAIVAVLVIAFARHGSGEPSAEVAPPAPAVPGGRVSSPLPPPPAGEQPAAPPPIVAAPTPPAPVAAAPIPPPPAPPAPVVAAPAPAVNVAPKPAAPIAAAPPAPPAPPPAKVVTPKPEIAKAEPKAETKAEIAKAEPKVETKVAPLAAKEATAKAAPSEQPSPPKVVAPKATPPRPVAVAARPAAAPAHPVVAPRAEGVVPARVTAPARPATASSRPAPTRPAAPAAIAATPHKAPVVATAPAAPTTHPAARPRTAEGAAAPAKRANGRQKLLADPDTTLPLTFD